MHKDEFESVAIRMFEHGTKRAHAGRAVKFRVRELRRTIVGHLRQKSCGIVVAINAAGVCVGRDLGEFAAKSQSEVAIGIVPVAIEEADHWLNVQRLGWAIWIDSQPGEGRSDGGNSGQRQCDSAFVLKAIEKLNR